MEITVEKSGCFPAWRVGDRCIEASLPAIPIQPMSSAESHPRSERTNGRLVGPAPVEALTARERGRVRRGDARVDRRRAVEGLRLGLLLEDQDAASRAVEYAHPSIRYASENRSSGVGGGIVDDYDLVFRIELSQGRVDGLLDEPNEFRVAIPVLMKYSRTDLRRRREARRTSKSRLRCQRPATPLP